MSTADTFVIEVPLPNPPDRRAFLRLVGTDALRGAIVSVSLDDSTACPVGKLRLRAAPGGSPARAAAALGAEVLKALADAVDDERADEKAGQPAKTSRAQRAP